MIAAIRRRREANQAAATLEGDAQRLEALVRETQESAISRRVLLLRLSSLPRHLAQPHHLRLARDALAPLAAADRARVFTLPNDDIVVVWRGDAGGALTASLDAVRLLFEDDADLPDPGVLAEVLRLPDEAEAVLATVSQSLEPDDQSTIAAKPAGRPLDIPTLTALEALLAQADVARLARRRSICAPAEEGEYALRWELRLLSVNELAEALVPGHDVLAEPWLFRRLTRLLDRRMLALLAAPDELRGAGPFGLSLNVSSILAPEFLRFDAALPIALRGQIVLGIAADDMVADPAAFLFARDFAHARQYRLMLRAVPANLLSVLPLRRTGLDLLELRWSDAMAELSAVQLGIEPTRTLLAGVDTAAALDWAMNNDLAYLTGRLVLPSRKRTGML